MGDWAARGTAFTQTWLRLDWTDLPWVVYGWARHWRDSALAWPAAVRELLPGPGGMYFCLALVLAVWPSCSLCH